MRNYRSVIYIYSFLVRSVVERFQLDAVGIMGSLVCVSTSWCALLRPLKRRNEQQGEGKQTSIDRAAIEQRGVVSHRGRRADSTACDPHTRCDRLPSRCALPQSLPEKRQLVRVARGLAYGVRDDVPLAVGLSHACLARLQVKSRVCVCLFVFFRGGGGKCIFVADVRRGVFILVCIPACGGVLTNAAL